MSPFRCPLSAVLLVGIAVPCLRADDSPSTEPTTVSESSEEKASPSRQVEIFVLQNASAGELAAALRNLFPNQDEDAETEIVPEPSTNSLLVKAPADVMETLRTIIKDRDADTSGNPELKRIAVRYAEAEPLRAQVRSMMDGLAANSQKRGQPRGAGNTALILADTRTNSLLVYATRQDQEVIGNLIAELDRPQHVLPDSSFNITVYAIRLPAGKASAVSREGLLPHAASDASLLAALAKLGDTRVIYAFDQHVALEQRSRNQFQSSCTFTPRVPASPAGQAVVAPPRPAQSASAGGELKGYWIDEAAGKAFVWFELKFSVPQGQDADPSSTGPASADYTFAQNYDGPMSVNGPALLLAVNGTADGGGACVIVTRLELRVAGGEGKSGQKQE